MRLWLREMPANWRPFMPWAEWGGTWQPSDDSGMGRTEGGMGQRTSWLIVKNLEEGKTEVGLMRDRGSFLVEVSNAHFGVLLFFITAGHIMPSEANPRSRHWVSLAGALCRISWPALCLRRMWNTLDKQPNLTATHVKGVADLKTNPKL